MATIPGYDDPDDAPPKTCHLHPINGCPDRYCRVCHQPTAEKSAICLDCQAAGVHIDPRDGYLVNPRR